MHLTVGAQPGERVSVPLSTGHFSGFRQRQYGHRQCLPSWSGILCVYVKPLSADQVLHPSHSDSKHKESQLPFLHVQQA